MPDTPRSDNGSVSVAYYSGPEALSAHDSQVHSATPLASDSHLAPTLWAASTWRTLPGHRRWMIYGQIISQQGRIVNKVKARHSATKRLCRRDPQTINRHPSQARALAMGGLRPKTVRASLSLSARRTNSSCRIVVSSQICSQLDVPHLRYNWGIRDQGAGERVTPATMM